MVSKATPPPWITQEYGAEIELGDKAMTNCITTIRATKVGRANAALIVRAVNAHDDLVKAAEAAINHLEVCEAGRIIHPFQSRSLPMLRAALVKAKEITV